MCSADDDPTTYDAPVVMRPRAYRLAGNAPESRGSVALAVIGEMLEEGQTAARSDPRRAAILQEVRRRIAAAEARL